MCPWSIHHHWHHPQYNCSKNIWKGLIQRVFLIFQEFKLNTSQLIKTFDIKFIYFLQFYIILCFCGEKWCFVFEKDDVSPQLHLHNIFYYVNWVTLYLEHVILIWLWLKNKVNKLYKLKWYWTVLQTFHYFFNITTPNMYFNSNLFLSRMTDFCVWYLIFWYYLM